MSPVRIVGARAHADGVRPFFSSSRERREKRPNLDKDEMDKHDRVIKQALMKRAGASGHDKPGFEMDADEKNQAHHHTSIMVDQIRRILKTMTAESEGCGVCFLLNGIVISSHKSGDDCPEGICSKDDEEWEHFRELMDYKYKLCYACLLPTVSTLDQPSPAPLSETQVTKDGIPGAKQHSHKVCTTPHLIKPALYAFWVRGDETLRTFVTEKINVQWETVERFTSWCVGVDKLTRLPNHLLLFWWIMKYHRGRG